MKNYSTVAEIAAFMAQIGDNPLFVCDMDGNVMIGYRLTEGHSLRLGPEDDSKRQSIPFNLPLADVEMFADQGVLQRGIFAEKTMDARLPVDLVALVNSNALAKEPFRLAFLTSRGADDARRLLKESGVEYLDRVTLVADSGATLYIDGKKHDVRKLSDAEKSHLQEVENIAAYLKPAIESIVRDYCPDAEFPLPDLFVEHKGVATNIHYREILTHCGQAENSLLDQVISSRITAVLETHVGIGPKEENGAPVFKTLGGPATVEMKVASVNKGHGLEAIMNAALSAPLSKRPSAAIFTGDDVAKGDGTPGTDWYAMDRTRALGQKHGIPTFNIHTHHPVGNDVAVDQADPKKSPDTLSAKFPKPPIDIVVKTPADLAKIILRADNHTQLVASESKYDFGLKA